MARWHGLTVNSLGYVTSICLPGNNCVGVVPESIGLLRFLRVLDLRLNQVHGRLPPSIGDCARLQRLHLQGNRLSGELPDSIGTTRPCRDPSLWSAVSKT